MYNKCVCNKDTVTFGHSRSRNANRVIDADEVMVTHDALTCRLTHDRMIFSLFVLHNPLHYFGLIAVSNGDWKSLWTDRP